MAIDWNDPVAVAEASSSAHHAAWAAALGLPPSTPLDVLVKRLVELPPDKLQALVEFIEADAAADLAHAKLRDVCRAGDVATEAN